jgi:hypothetical protein
MAFFAKIEKSIVHMETQGTPISQNNFEKNNCGCHLYPDYKTFYKATVKKKTTVLLA